jgi:hypothetical protein
MTTIEEELAPHDLSALQLAYDKCRASSATRAKQLEEMAAERGWMTAAEFASFDRQTAALHLKPWQSPPCWVADANDPCVGEEEGARLLRRMLKAGVSRFHPDPMRALSEATSNSGEAT